MSEEYFDEYAEKSMNKKTSHNTPKQRGVSKSAEKNKRLHSEMNAPSLDVSYPVLHSEDEEDDVDSDGEEIEEVNEDFCVKRIKYENTTASFGDKEKVKELYEWIIKVADADSYLGLVKMLTPILDKPTDEVYHKINGKELEMEYIGPAQSFAAKATIAIEVLHPAEDTSKYNFDIMISSVKYSQLNSEGTLYIAREKKNAEILFLSSSPETSDISAFSDSEVKKRVSISDCEKKYSLAEGPGMKGIRRIGVPEEKFKGFVTNSKKNDAEVINIQIGMVLSDEKKKEGKGPIYYYTKFGYESSNKTSSESMEFPSKIETNGTVTQSNQAPLPEIQGKSIDLKVNACYRVQTLQKVLQGISRNFTLGFDNKNIMYVVVEGFGGKQSPPESSKEKTYGLQIIVPSCIQD